VTPDGGTTLGSVKGAQVTARRAEILALLARHLTYARIADALFSARTVDSYVSAMLWKPQLPDRRSLALVCGGDAGSSGQIRQAWPAVASDVDERSPVRPGGWHFGDQSLAEPQRGQLAGGPGGWLLVGWAAEQAVRRGVVGGDWPGRALGDTLRSSVTDLTRTSPFGQATSRTCVREA
jgi:hypothetical protein